MPGTLRLPWQRARSNRPTHRLAAPTNNRNPTPAMFFVRGTWLRWNKVSEMNDTQILTIALASAPTMLTVLIGILINNARLSDMSGRLGDTNGRIAELRAHMDARFDDMRDTWRSELRRVEEVIDARLKHLED